MRKILYTHTMKKFGITEEEEEYNNSLNGTYMKNKL